MCDSLVKDIGEQKLLKLVQRFCPQDIIGDDGAVVPSPELGQSLVVTTDVLVDGVHFSDRTTTPYDVGYRAATANLSDLAAMGASPLGITVGLSLRGDMPVSWVEELYQGMTQCLNKYHTPIVGGDICRSQVITVSITAFGQVLPDHIIRRSTAKVGDAIIVTGVHGAAKAGLALLLHPELGKNLPETERLSLIKAHQRPQPRLDVLPLLWDILYSEEEKANSQEKIPLSPPLPLKRASRLGLLVTARDGRIPLKRASRLGLLVTARDGRIPLKRASRLGLLVTARDCRRDSPLHSPLPICGMDSSDGLADAIVQICRSSGVGAVIERSSIPIPIGLNQLVSAAEVWHWILYGGEDFELVLSLPEAPAKLLVERLGKSAAVIGYITDGEDIWLRDSTGIYEDELLSLTQGFQHF